MSSEQRCLLDATGVEKPEPGKYPGLWSYERAAWRAGYRLVAGVDEAGRGPLAGPVVAAAVILPSDFDPQGVRDSKAMNARERQRSYRRIMDGCHAAGVAVVDRAVIDEINILQASRLAMRLAVEDIGLRPELCLIDGLRVPGFPFSQWPIVKGDSLSVSIAAASIIAKVTRDRLMTEMDARYPGYGFARHKGYATVEHIQALQNLGACPEHRLSFHVHTEPEAEPCLVFDRTR